MKQNWTYKKLKHYITEYSVKNRNDEDIPVYSVTNSQGFCREYFSKEVASKDKTTYKIVPKGFFAYNPSRINVGSIDWQNKEDKVIVSPLYVVFEVSKELSQNYLLYYIKSRSTMAYINAVATGTVRANLKLSMLGEFTIPVPPLAEQQRMVSELDLLQGIIDKQQAQLKELDTLAQSIFYDMFGDPVENEKGWEVKRLGEVCDIVAGGDKPDDISTIRTNEYCYPVIANGDGDKGILGYSKTRRIVNDAVTIGARGASIGNCRIVYGGFTPVVRLIVLSPNDSVNCTYLFYFAKQMPYYSNGAGQAQLTVPNVRSAHFTLPPLRLQEEFASKIELIEKQKTAISQTIAETRKLFEYTMDKYFG